MVVKQIKVQNVVENVQNDNVSQVLFKNTIIEDTFQGEKILE